MIDVLILGSISSAVVVLTLRVCELTLQQWRMLPPVPMLGFLLLLCGGYLVLFTAAGGQTIGKMAARIRVVGTSPDTGNDERLNIQRAVVRSLVTLPSVLALGAGFLPALFGERRAVHDRIAQTRVIRV